METLVGILVVGAILSFVWSYYTSNYFLIAVGVLCFFVAGGVAKAFNVSAPQWAHWVIYGVVALVLLLIKIWLLRSGEIDECLGKHNRK